MTTFNDRLTVMRYKLEESTEGVWDDDMLLDDYNHFMRTVSIAAPPELLAEYDFTASSRLTALPSTFKEMVALYRGTTKCYRMDLNEVAGIDLSGTGTPSHYTIINGSVALWPVPTSSLTASMHLKYQAWPTALTGTSSTITVPDDYLPCIEAGVLARAYEQTGEVDMADLNWRAYDRYLRDLMNQAERENVIDHVSQPAEAW